MLDGRFHSGFVLCIVQKFVHVGVPDLQLRGGPQKP